MHTEQPLGVTPQELIDSAFKSMTAVKMGSKLRSHYLELVRMNNIFRAINTLYKVDDAFVQSQKDLLKILLDVESRKNRAWFTVEVIRLFDILEDYRAIVSTFGPDQLNEVLQYVADNSKTNAWLVTAKKG